jgi:hypothetical protein
VVSVDCIHGGGARLNATKASTIYIYTAHYHVYIDWALGDTTTLLRCKSHRVMVHPCETQIGFDQVA